MNLIIAEVLQQSKMYYTKGVESDDSRLSDRAVYSELLVHRSELLTQQSNKKQSFNSSTYQTLHKIDMEDVELVSGSSLLLMRSVKEIPLVLNDNSGFLIESVTNLEGSTRYNYTTKWHTFYNRKGRKFTSSIPGCILKDNRIWITTKRKPETIIMRAIFYDPIQASLFNITSECKENCAEYSSFEFNMESDKLRVLTTMVGEKLIDKFGKAQPDLVNNSSEQ